MSKIVRRFLLGAVLVGAVSSLAPASAGPQEYCVGRRGSGQAVCCQPPKEPNPGQKPVCYTARGGSSTK
jgi:hypothetical protein